MIYYVISRAETPISSSSTVSLPQHRHATPLPRSSRVSLLSLSLSLSLSSIFLSMRCHTRTLLKASIKHFQFDNETLVFLPITIELCRDSFVASPYINISRTGVHHDLASFRFIREFRECRRNIFLFFSYVRR